MKMMQRLLRNEQGSTMAAVLMVSMVVMAIGVTSMQTAQHSNDVTSVDRERLQTIESAEAGVHHAIQAAEAGQCRTAVTALQDLKDGDELLGQFRTRIDPEAGQTCTGTRRVIHSWGYAPTGGTRALRHVQVALDLKPNAGFSYSLFAEGGTGTIYVKNNGQINGDVYAEVLDQSKNNLTAEDVVTPDSILTQNNATYSGTLWAGGNVTVGANSNIGGSVLAAGSKSGTQGNVVFGNKGNVERDVQAKGTVTLGSTTVQGTVSQNNSGIAAPPNLQKPSFTWNAAAYTPAPTINTSANITTALNTNKNALSGTYYNSSGSGSSITIPDGARVTGDLTIVSTGRVILGNGFTAVGGPWKVVIVALSTAANAIDANKAMTSSSGVDLLLWTQGGVDLKNNVVMTGAIYADYIDIKNGLTVNYSSSLAQYTAPNFTFTGSSATSYSAVPMLWREVVPGEPPA